jgi:hypothetical protein
MSLLCSHWVRVPSSPQQDRQEVETFDFQELAMDGLSNPAHQSACITAGQV